MAISVPGAQDEFVRARGLLQEVYKLDPTKIRPQDVTEIAALSEGGRVSVDDLMPLYHDAVHARLVEVSIAQSSRVGRR